MNIMNKAKRKGKYEIKRGVIGRINTYVKERSDIRDRKVKKAREEEEEEGA